MHLSPPWDGASKQLRLLMLCADHPPRVLHLGYYVGVDDLLKGCARVAAPQTALAGFFCLLSHFLLLTLACSATCMALT